MSTDPKQQFGREAEKYLTSAVHADPDALGTLIGLVQPKGGTVLDVGTGAGHLAMALAPHVDKVIALDPTPKMLDVTAREAARRGITNLETLESHAESLPFEAASLDGVSCRLATHHFDSVHAFVNECVRTLKPGGWLLVVDTVAPDDPDAAHALNEFETVRDPSHRRDWAVREWVECVKAAGFEVVAVHDRFKRLNLDEWMDRMSVSDADRVWLKKACDDSTGAFRTYLDPNDGEFNLQEMTLLARKQS